LRLRNRRTLLARSFKHHDFDNITVFKAFIFDLLAEIEALALDFTFDFALESVFNRRRSFTLCKFFTDRKSDVKTRDILVKAFEEENLSLK
jgi:hypothetical protein